MSLDLYFILFQYCWSQESHETMSFDLYSYTLSHITSQEFFLEKLCDNLKDDPQALTKSDC